MDGRNQALVKTAGAIWLTAGLMIFSSSASAAVLKKPIYTNNTRFQIPFNSDVASLERMNAREIQLYVSRDSGANWELAYKLPADGKRFQFRSPSDGEYWFSVKTLDGQNQLHPPLGKYETGLIVVVDTEKPSLEISVQQSSPGKLQLNWQASDHNLDHTSLKVEYLVQGSQSWEAVTLDSQSSGEAHWAVHQSGVVSIRATIADLASNSVQTMTQVPVEINGDRSIRTRPVLNGPVADGHPDDSSTAAKSESRNRPSTVNIPVAEHNYSGPIITPLGGIPRYPQGKLQNASSNRSLNAIDRQPVDSVSSGVTTSTPTSSAEHESLPPYTTAVPVASSESLNPSRPRPSLRRIVASHRFQIGYEIDNIGPSGLSGVELFITEDEGKTWFIYDESPDQKSSFEVAVRQDGKYGFSIRGRSGVGLAVAAPIPGEPPAISVCVDQTPPIVELLPVEQGRGSNANQLKIRWKLQDQFPSEKPVSLQYSSTLNGPWEEICDWIEDSAGGYTWTVGPSVRGQFYIRVRARDAAGNVTSVETQTPNVIDLQRPVARIIEIGVDPTSGAK